ncbi:hypothetical protein [Roseibium algae]|uniref:Transmembrane protein n=1 Tax=Roseibium algae TaxID=3123038 RepID=A0ABU8TMX9_9HYPH
MIPIELPRSSGVKPIHFTILAASITALTLVYLIYLSARWTGYWQNDVIWVSDPATNFVQVNGSKFAVPAGLMRNPAHGLSRLARHQTMSSLKLDVAWPAMTGFKRDGTTPTQSQKIQIEISASTDGETMRDRLKPVYKRLARGPEADGPAGLKILTLSSPVALKTDQVVFEPDRPNGFIARCLKTKNQQALCTREIRLSDGLLVTYQFAQGLLASWGRLDRRVDQLVKSLRQ